MKRVTISLRTKILLLCLFSILTALVLQLIFFQNSASNIIYEQEKRSGQNSLKNIQNALYGRIKSYENSLIKIYENADFIRDVSVGSDSRELYDLYKNLAYHMAIDYFEPDQNIGALYLYDKNNRLISSYRSANTPRFNYPENLYQASEMNNMEVIQSYINSDRRSMLISGYWNQPSRRKLIRFVIKVFSSNSKEMVAYIICDISPAGFQQIIREHSYSESQFVWIQAKNDQSLISYGSLAPDLNPFYDYKTSMVKSGETGSTSAEIINDSVFMQRYLEKYDLTIYSLTPQFLLTRSQKELGRNMSIIALLVLSVSALVVLLISQTITTPLKNIVLNLKQIRDGKTQLRLSGITQDEIGLLAVTINEMLDRIQELAAQEYHLEILLRQAEYRTLQAQVNPHFLYNTLDTMSGIAISQNCRSVSLICNALSNIFRYSIDMKDPLSTIEREVFHIKNYIYVINERNRTPIELSIQIEPENLSVKIPRLTLQPIVENAVNHGLKNKRGNKKIEIKSEYHEGDVILTISDNGNGMDVDDVRKGISGKADRTLDLKDSIGLSNIQSRIKILFGNSYGLTLAGSKGKGSSISIRIPFGVDKTDCGESDGSRES